MLRNVSEHYFCLQLGRWHCSKESVSGFFSANNQWVRSKRKCQTAGLHKNDRILYKKKRKLQNFVRIFFCNQPVSEIKTKVPNSGFTQKWQNFVQKKEKIAEFCPDFFLQPTSEWDQNESAKQRVWKNVIFGHFVVFELFVFDLWLVANFGLLWQPVSSGHRLVRKVSTP